MKKTIENNIDKISGENLTYILILQGHYYNRKDRKTIARSY